MTTRSLCEDTHSRPEVLSVRTGSLQIAASRFPAGLSLPLHEHDCPIFAVFLRGAMDIRFQHHQYACTRGTVQIHPPDERHSQHFDAAVGADLLVVEPDPDWIADFRPFRAVFEGIGHFNHAGIESTARRAASELRTPDELSPVVLESLALEMLADAARFHDVLTSRRRPPAWLQVASQRLRESFLETVSASGLAEEAGVHPGHLARAFRRYHGVTVGDYVRRLRLDWAAERLAGSDNSIAQIAAEAGFADQSHFTRAFKSYSGRTPADYRARSSAH